MTRDEAWGKYFQKPPGISDKASFNAGWDAGMEKAEEIAANCHLEGYDCGCGGISIVVREIRKGIGHE